VGLAVEQRKSNFILHTKLSTDASDLNSGDSRRGHEYGTSLPEVNKIELLEYLKKL
jgi:hypothetical protein